mmetsp:Transcript_4165/g.9531  ORF Transcript_4165/g.9531 Transcript_4165/m.9531 type:complete len:82 (+) Transcript_4165:913-1158(+)
MAVASHGLIRLLLASFCSFADRSLFNPCYPKHYYGKAYMHAAAAASVYYVPLVVNNFEKWRTERLRDSFVGKKSCTDCKTG